MVKKIFSAVTIGAMFLTLVTPGFATVKTLGKTKKAPPKIETVKYDLTYIKQSNTTNALVGISQIANTGENTIKDNKGGSSSITTGKAVNTATVRVTGGNNTVTIDPCCGECNCEPVDPCECGEQVMPCGGCGVKPSVKEIDVQMTTVVQTNTTNAMVGVMQVANTGDNQVKDNVSCGGTNTIDTAKAENTATVTVQGGDNTATL